MVIKNSVFWSDFGGVLHTDGAGRERYVHRTCLNNQLRFLECQYTGSDYWGVFAITNGDNMTIKDITVENCRVEDFSYSEILLSFSYRANMWVKAPGGPIQKDVAYSETSPITAQTSMPAISKGYDSTRCEDGVTFEDVQINGKHILDAKQGKFQIGPFAKNVVFK